MRGIAVCQEISDDSSCMPSTTAPMCGSVIRRELSRRRRALEPAAHAAGAQDARRRGVADRRRSKLQGALFFGSTEQLLRRIAAARRDGALHRSSTSSACTSPTSAARKLIRRARALNGGGQTELLFAGFARRGPACLAALDARRAEENGAARALPTSMRRSNGARTSCSRSRSAGSRTRNSRCPRDRPLQGLTPDECRRSNASCSR